MSEIFMHYVVAIQPCQKPWTQHNLCTFCFSCSLQWAAVVILKMITTALSPQHRSWIFSFTDMLVNMLQMCHERPAESYDITDELCSVRYMPLHSARFSCLIPRLTEILIKLAVALSLSSLLWRSNDHTPTSILCCLLTNNRNLFFIKLSGLGTIRVWAGGGGGGDGGAGVGVGVGVGACVCVCACVYLRTGKRGRKGGRN